MNKSGLPVWGYFEFGLEAWNRGVIQKILVVGVVKVEVLLYCSGV